MLAALVLLVGGAAAAAAPGDFEDWIERFGKVYSTPEERAARREIFELNKEIVDRTNAAGLGYELEVNTYADVTGREFAKTHGGVRPDNSTVRILGTHGYSGGDLPTSIDWVAKGAVTPVKDQGSCGSCWAFSSTGSIEGAWKIATGNLVSLSEQQLVDCAKYRWGDAGCSGGMQIHAFKYIEQAPLCTEKAYPYLGKNSLFQKCGVDRCSGEGVGLAKGLLSGYKQVASTEEALMEALTQQPVAVNIEADQDVFHLYKSGIVQGAGCGKTLDHAVLAVGYGEDNGVKYWKVKNSWTTKWGEQGYVRVIRGSDECGILDGPPLYPVLKKVSEQGSISV